MRTLLALALLLLTRPSRSQLMPDLPTRSAQASMNSKLAAVETRMSSDEAVIAGLSSTVSAQTTTIASLSATIAAQQAVIDKLTALITPINTSGNLATTLPSGERRLVINTALNNLVEEWVGTPSGNRLLTVLGGSYTITPTLTQTVFQIPHGLPYTPQIYNTNVSLPVGIGNLTRTVNATSNVATTPTAITPIAPYIFNYYNR